MERSGAVSAEVTVTAADGLPAGFCCGSWARDRTVGQARGVRVRRRHWWGRWNGVVERDGEVLALFVDDSKPLG